MAAEGGGLALGSLAAIALGAASAAAGPYTEAGYDPSLMAAWASSVVEVVRGPMDVAQPGLGNAGFGAETNALGPSGSGPFDVVSLGDGGHITLHFDTGIGDGPGDDFAVYENGFWTLDGLFAELAFVEVSTDGVVFQRFDSTSLRTTPVSGPNGEVVDPTDYHNFAGKHARGEGTGFDLAELGLGGVSYVRFVDAIGDGSTQDHLGAAVYDPYQTPFDSGGFDLDAVGVLHLPEPGGAALLGSGLATLVGLARRRREAACEPAR